MSDGRLASPAQRLLNVVLPAKWFADLEAETRRWEVACKTCGRSKDLWEAGGLRWRATAPSETSGFCSACDAKRTMQVRAKGADRSRPDGP
ncbi:MAG: hypothetical protein AAF390_11800 [Pseudomonadota bacterium]